MKEKVSALFFSRGKGYGHAIPDMDVGAALMDESSAPMDIRYVSYATGAKAFKLRGIPVVDLGLMENNSYLETLDRALGVIAKNRPDVVIAHEEFAALMAAHLSGVPSVYIGDWLPPARTMPAESLGYADAIYVFERPGVFHAPYPMKVPPVFFGPMVRNMKHTVKDRADIRRELAIPAEAFVLLVCPGGSVTEQQASIAPVVTEAYSQLPGDAKRMYWITDRDYDHVRRLTGSVPGVTVLRFSHEIDKLMAASSVVVTKGTRVTIVETASIGVPSLTLSFGLNPMDDLLASLVKSNTQLNGPATDARALAGYLTAAATFDPQRFPPFSWVSAAEVAARMRVDIQRLVAVRRLTKVSAETVPAGLPGA